MFYNYYLFSKVKRIKEKGKLIGDHLPTKIWYVIFFTEMVILNG